SLVTDLAAHSFEFPCGGRGECSGCQVRVLSGSLPVTEADADTFSVDQLAQGWRLACQARAPNLPNAPLVLECLQWHMHVLTDGGVFPAQVSSNTSKIAIDLGTTT